MTDSATPPASKPGSPSSSISMWHLSMVAVVIVILIAVVLPPVRKAIEAQRRDFCKSRLREIGLALHYYHDEYGSFPPAYTVGANGEKLHSWRSLILPYLGQGELYAKINWNEPWDSPHNKALAQTPISLYCCPSAGGSPGERTNYFAIVDRATLWPEQYSAKLSDIHDGPSNTLMLVESSVPGIHWMEPRDLTREEATACIHVSGDRVTNHQAGTHVLLADGAVRFVSTSIDPKTLRSLLSINGGAAYPGVDWPLIAITEQEFPDDRPAEDFKKTLVWPVVDRDIEAGKNLVYCCTFQMAWDQGREFAGGEEIQLKDAPPLVKQLNAAPFPKGQLRPEDCVALGGIGSEVVPKAQNELKSKFPTFKSRLLEMTQIDGVGFYAMLKKDLPFATSFDRFEEKLSFDNKRVASFGVIEIDEDDKQHIQLLKQVKVLDYVSDDDFVIRLSPRSEDEIVLAKIPHKKTLGETIASVRERIAAPHPRHSRFQMVAGETLIVPVLLASIDRTYSDLSSLDFANASYAGRYVIMAQQIIRFRLNEHGAKIESEAIIVSDFGEPDQPPQPRKLVFDKPFLIWLRETQPTEPYFAAWIENAELMELAK